MQYLYRKEVTVAISIRLSPEDEERLEQLAANTGRSKTFYVREAIHEHLDDLEERYWADRVIRDWESAGRASRPADELWAELGI
jgi:RHH-type rel operon transcriptional repressor/antitoxin RelB